MQQLLGAEDPDEWDWARERQDIEFYFSATAICITTLARLKPNTRMKVRYVVLQEDCRGVGNPKCRAECHAEGLIQFCTENPKLRIHTHAGPSTNLAPSSGEIWHPMSRPYVSSLHATHYYVRVLVEWLIRTASLPSRGLPPGSFTVDLDMRAKEAAHPLMEIH
jgi:hypothetical protein